MARSRDSRRNMTARPTHYGHIVSILVPVYKREGEHTGSYCPNAVPQPSGLGVDRRGSRRVRRLRRDLPGGRRFGTFAGIVVVVVVGAPAAVGQGCSIPASREPCPAAVAPTMQAETWAAAALSSHRTLPSPASLGPWSAFRAIAWRSLRRQGLGLHGKKSCQFNLCEVRNRGLAPRGWGCE